MHFYLILLFLAALPAAAESTRTWEQTRYDEFEKGVGEHLSLHSDGRLALAPRFKEIYDAPSAYLWALARDSKGNLYAGGGPGARVLRIGADGKASKVFENEALEIHALAVDRRDNVYAATSPDSKVFKIDPAGKSSLFLDPKVKYIWGMAFNSRGDLFLATGGQGEVYRVDPSGKPQLFFKTDDSHIRSLVIEPNDDVVIGTDPGGVVLRVPADGSPGFVLHQSSKKEITALVRGADGSLYAAGVGNRTRPTTPPPPPASVPTSPAPVPTMLGGPAALQSAPAPQTAPLPSTVRAGVIGGSEVFRINPDGSPRKLWSSGDEVVYALGFGAGGRLLIGTGNQGRIYQIESDQVYSLLLKAAPAQVTGLLQSPGGQVFAATGNVGKIYQIGPELETRGTFESEVFDAGVFSRWGRLSWTGAAPETASLTVQTRSGNLSTPAQYWSGWSKPVTRPEGQPVDSPPARFVQWKAVLEARNGDSPVLDSVSLAYLSKNIAPVITDIDITPPNYRFPDPPAPSTTPKPLSLPQIGSKPSSRSSSSPTQPPRSMNAAKGSLGARWLAQDDNDDELVFKVEIRGRNERQWKLLRDKLDDPYLSWDSTSFADGVYQLRITASDEPDNPGSDALTYSKESDPFVIDNTAPAVSGLTAVRESGRLRVRFRVADAFSDIDRSEYSIDGSEWRPMSPVTALFDSRDLEYNFITGEVKPGEHTVAIRVWDANDNVAAAKIVVGQSGS